MAIVDHRQIQHELAGLRSESMYLSREIERADAADVDWLRGLRDRLHVWWANFERGIRNA